MNDDVRWFSCLCIDAGILTREQVKSVYELLGEDVELLAFGQHIVDEGISTEGEAIQKLLYEACDRVDAGEEPPYNPLAIPMNLAKSTAEEAPASPEEPAPKEVPVEPAPTPIPAAKPVEAPSERPAPISAEPAPVTVEPAPASVEPETAPTSKLKASKRPPEAVIAADGLDPLPLDFAEAASMGDQQLRAGLISLLKYCVEQGVSDLHLSAAARPFQRKDRANHYLDETVLSPELSTRLNMAFLSAEQIEYLQREKDYDFSIPLSTGERFRVNLMYHKDGLAGTYRIVPSKIKSLEALGFENAETIKKLLSYHNGLILVTGPVGSGKTATLSSLMHEMNNNREDHIIAVEDPIEVVQVSNKCSITQRGVGPHTHSFQTALKGALRQDPDIIVIGEMRDLETIEMAISASETGHLVMGTMHTSDAATTLNRLLDVFPPSQQTQIRAMVAESLRGIICQRLLPGKDGGLVLACELLLKNTAVSTLIREGKAQGLGNIMETGKAAGMIQMDASVLKLYRDGKITAEVARENINNESIRVQVT